MSELSLDSLLSTLSDSPVENQIEKAASEQVSVADTLKNALTKEASASNTTGENTMTVETGNAIADSVLSMLEKSAGMHGDGGGNKVVSDLDTMVMQHDDRIEQTPRQGKTITETAKALQMRGGGEMMDNVDTKEGNEPSNMPAKPSDIEKAAAVSELMEEGIDFEDAVELVKQASEEMEAEELDLEKAAAVSTLIAEGIDFDDAVSLVKQASEELADEGEYTDLEKAAAVQELMEEDGLGFEEAAELVKEAALGK